MRRKDREMDPSFGLQVLDNSDYGTLAMVDLEGKPYCIPISFVVIDEFIYFHSARAGKKVQILEQHPVICMSFVSYVQVPRHMTREKIEEAISAGRFGELASKVFTTEFASCYVEGICQIVEDDEESIRVLVALCKKHVPEMLDYAEAGARHSLKATQVYRVQITKLTAKRKAFDASGQEMKWGRME